MPISRICAICSFHCKACYMFKRLDSFQSDWLKKTAYLLVALLVQALLDYGELLLPSFDFQTCERGFDNPMHVLVHLLLCLSCRVLERAIRSCVAHIHLVRLVLIWLHNVCNQVDKNRVILLDLVYLDVIFNASKHCNVVGCNPLNFGKEFLLSLFGHLPVADSHVELILVRLLGRYLDHTSVIFHDILQLHWRLSHFLCFTSSFLYNILFVIDFWYIIDLTSRSLWFCLIAVQFCTPVFHFLSTCVSIWKVFF